MLSAPRFRLSVRSLLILMCVFAVGLRIALDPEVKRRRLIGRINASGGSVATEGGWGQIWAGNVTEVNLPGTAFSVIPLEELKLFPKLHQVRLNVAETPDTPERPQDAQRPQDSQQIRLAPSGD